MCSLSKCTPQLNQLKKVKSQILCSILFILRDKNPDFDQEFRVHYLNIMKKDILDIRATKNQFAYISKEMSTYFY